MTGLLVPYVEQIHEASCGIAAFEMVLRYYSKVSKINQRKTYERLFSGDPHRPGASRVTTDNVVGLAHTKKFKSEFGRVSTDSAIAIKQIQAFIDQATPLIACVQSEGHPKEGHFVVIYGYDGDDILFHDPLKQRKGQRANIVSFLNRWKRTGVNVTGGVAIWISKSDRSGILDPDLPNNWFTGWHEPGDI